MRHTIATGVVLATILSAGCVSTKSVGYADGVVTTSPVTLRCTALPVLQQAQGATYRVTGDAGSTSIAALDQRGMRASTGTTDVEIRVALGAMKQGDAGAMKSGSGWLPAFTVTVPYSIVLQHRGEQVGTRNGTYENMLTFQGGQTFPTREQAVAAIDAVRKLAEKGLTKRAHDEAAKEAMRAAGEAAAGLFEPRQIQLEVPVVRSAAGVDLQACYTLLTDPTDAAKVREGLTAYEDAGTDQRKPDGSPNKTASYGVACGIAAARLLLGDGAGAWAATQLADQFEANGQEADAIRLTIYRQEKATGVAVIPAADRERIQAAERTATSLQQLLGAPPR
ncbi:MAG TPA: hypothetical protein VFT55_03175 [Planctomycetota bacterium]|nr:hypothetical protein [Planctomycetota bacterium]